jgi:hypothetical protein
MKLVLTPQDFANEYTITTLVPVNMEDWRDKKQGMGDDAPAKTAEDGSPLYGCQLNVIQTFDDGKQGEAQNLFFSLKEKTELKPFQPYTLTGEIKVVPFVRNNRIAYSLTADKIVPLTRKPAEGS